MSFTLAHPSIIIFCKNRYLNLMGFILGSMSPDFIYFLCFNPSSNFGHTVLGFIFFNLPLCTLLNFLIFRYVKTIFILSLPNFLLNRYSYLIYSSNKLDNLKNFFIFIYSTLFGMLTHVFWDAFTHESGFFVNSFPLFFKKSLVLLNHEVPIYKLFQHGSTLIGFLIIIIYFYSIQKNSNKKTLYRLNKIKIFSTIFITILITFFLSYIYTIITNSYFGIGRLVVTFINGVFLGYIFAGIVTLRSINKKTAII